MVDYSRGYSVYDAIRARTRARAIGQQQVSSADAGYGKTPGDTGLRSATSGAVGVGQYNSPFLDETASFGYSPDSGVVNLAENPELRAIEGMKNVSRPEAAAKADLSYYGFDPSSTFGKAANSFMAALDPTPFSFLSGMVSGTSTVDPYGRSVAKPIGSLGLVSEMNVEKQYEVAEKIRAGTPGYHQFYSGGNLVSISPQSLLGQDLGYAISGTFSGSTQDAINLYASAMGYDPATVNLQSRPGKKDFGIELDAFVPGSGGFTAEGNFVNAQGKTGSISNNDLRDHLGLTADIYGIDAAYGALSRANVSQDVRTSMMEAIQTGALTANAVVDKNGNTVGYETGSGSVVRSGDGSIVTSGDGTTPVTSGSGIMSVDMFNSLREEAKFMEESGANDTPQVGTQTVGGKTYTTTSGGDSGNEPSPSRSSTSQAAASEDAYDPSDTYFAEGGPVQPNEVPLGDAPVASQAGFVGGEPEGIPNGQTVADDVPMEVPEGTFVLNAAAVEYMGSADVKKMILDAMQEAEKQGIDVKQQNSQIPKEDLVSLVVSKGEVIIPPQLAEIIGYDRLNKINNRGKAEVERRTQESEPAPKPQVLAQLGGFISRPA